MTAARAASVSGRDPVISVPNESGETGEFLAPQTVFVLPARANFRDENKHLPTELGS